MRNHLKISILNLCKQRVLSSINIFGLAGSIAVCIIISLYVRESLETDKFHANYKNIYRIEQFENHKTSPPIGPFLKENFPEVIEFVRIKQLNIFNHNLRYLNKTISFDNIWLADSSFFNIFTFPLKQGNPIVVLNSSDWIVLSESTAKKMFGDEDPIGKIVTYGSRFDLEVSGIMKDFPSNSSIQADAIVPLEFIRKVYRYPGVLEKFVSWNYSTFLLLRPNKDYKQLATDFKENLNDFINKNSMDQTSTPTEFILSPLKEIYFNSYKTNDYLKHGKRSNIFIAIWAAIFVLILAIINFTNISAAQVYHRFKEIGLRKTLGASNSSLVIDHIVNSIISSSISIFLALGLVELLIPPFSSFLNYEITSSIYNPVIIYSILLGPILLGVLGGIYPAYSLSKFPPINILSEELNKGNKGMLMRKALMIIQFTTAIVFTTFTFHISKQVNSLYNKDIGVDKHDRMVIETPPELSRKVKVLLNEFQSNPNIISASIHSTPLGIINEVIDIKDKDELLSFRIQYSDSNYLNTMNLKLIEGRNIRNYEVGDSIFEILINKTAVEKYKIDNPIGKVFKYLLGKYMIVGILDDYHFESLHKPIYPLMIRSRPSNKFLTIHFLNGKDRDISEFVKNLWQNYSPTTPIVYNLLIDDLKKLYQEEARLKKMIVSFTILSIFIACLGLFGLVAFSIGKRIKEIGIRKVLGSSTAGVVGYLVWQFLKIVLISMLISIPFSWWLITKWLQNFMTPAGHSIWLYIGSGTLVLVIAMLTVIYHSTKAANTNPADVLKYE